MVNYLFITIRTDIRYTYLDGMSWRWPVSHDGLVGEINHYFVNFKQYGLGTANALPEAFGF